MLRSLKKSVGCFCALAWTLPAVAQPNLVSPPERTTVFPEVVGGVAVADFDGDGNPDLVATLFARTGLAIRLSNGDGTFREPVNVSLPYPVFWVAAADLDGDGTPDLIVKMNDDASPPGKLTTWVALNRGNLSFQPPVKVSDSGDSLVVADFNGDGILDIAQFSPTSSGKEEIQVLLGVGDGTFQPAISTASEMVGELQTADLNGDGALDLVALSAGSQFVEVLLGKGDGTFQPQPNVATDPQSLPVASAIADLDGDGNPDLMIAGSTGTLIFWGSGDGSFGSPVTLSATGDSIVIVDVDGDGNPDIVLGGPAGSDLKVMQNRGKRKFEASPGLYSFQRPFASGGKLAAADFDKNGRPDFVFSDSAYDPTPSGGVYVAMNAAPKLSMFLSRLVNAASEFSGPVAPGEIVTLQGAGLGQDQLQIYQLASDGSLATALGGTRVLFDGVAAPLIYTRSDIVSAIVPTGVAAKSTTKITVDFNGTKSAALVAPVAATSPAIFSADSSGKGQGSILNEDGTPNSDSNRALPGSTVTIFVNGVGQLKASGVPVAPMSVLIGGRSAEIVKATVSSLPGVFQVQAKIPDDTSAGPAPIAISVGAPGPVGVTVAIGP